MAGLYDNLRKWVIPLNVSKAKVTSSFGLIGGQTVAGPGNEGVDVVTWINERITSGDINVAAIAGGYTTVQDEGNALTNRDTINFVGSGVTVTDLGGATTVTISSGAYTDEQAQDAIGAMVDTTLTYTDGGPILGRSAITGDVSIPTSSNAATIANDVVTNAKLSNMAASTIKGSVAGGDPADLTPTQVKTILAITGADVANTPTGTIVASTVQTALNELDTDKQADIQFQDETVAQGIAGGITTVNFAGAGVTAVAGGSTLTVTIPGGTSYTNEDAQDAVGAMIDTSLVYVDGTPLLTRAALTGDVTATQGSNATTIATDAVTNTKLANMAANTVKVNNTASPGDPVDMALAANTLVGRGSTGDIAAITVSGNLSFSGGVLSATGGAGISEVEVGSTLIRYVILTGTPVFTANIASGVQTIAATGGTFKLVSVATTGATANLAGDNSFTIIYNGVPGTTLLAYPDIAKWNLSGSAPSSGVPDIHSLAASPQHQVIGGVAGTSITIRLINMNAYTNWCIKSIW